MVLLLWVVPLDVKFSDILSDSFLFLLIFDILRSYQHRVDGTIPHLQMKYVHPELSVFSFQVSVVLAVCSVKNPPETKVSHKESFTQREQRENPPRNESFTQRERERERERVERVERV